MTPHPTPSPEADLIARLENATEPDRANDGRIYIAAYGEATGIAFYDKRTGGLVVRDDCPEFTGSIDAAVSLVPEGVDWGVDCRDEGDVDNWYEALVGEHLASVKSTPAIALCIASLRARAHAKETTDE